MTTTLDPPTARHGTRVDARPARTDSVIRYLAGVAVAASLVVVTYLWLAGGGIEDLGSWADGLTSTGRWTGLLASDLLLVQVLLMARIPPLERSVGQDRLARVHRLVGFTSFTLMLLHLVLITWGYAAGRISALPGTFWTLTVDYPGMLLALAGTACLVLVVVTSVRAARNRLRHESWHLLHLYAYLGVGLALPHQLWTGQELLSSTAATVYWWTLWAAAAAAVLVWRVGLPVLRSLRHDLRVTSVVPEAHDVVSVYVTGRAMDRLPVAAGQFLTWRFLSGPGWTRAHPYSLSAAPDGRSLRITVKDLGDGSRLVRSLRLGTRVLVEGPYGRLTARPRTRDRVALIGAGVGITPLRALAEGLSYAPGDAVLLQRGTGAPLFAAEFDVLARERGLRVHWLPGRRRAPDSWLGEGAGPADDLAVLLALIPDVAQRDVYLCGPEAWSASVHRTLAAARVPEGRIHVETFGW
ncbi:ferric reductase-like transmembrane domain-containing protein [Pseudonocardia sp. RS11V-5]|uniref:ferredoxin reductase family protein n=1 Tax=Pseudonocardia terrae TaxID=2905831 RepID=UPI001E4690F5|nr:ferredoxin reductase family protein [Pseudonocardia terrae]MCE3553265.1 ferric reductase-like transmembrane domain-containing protein [Pseudonocardia terrae]